ncbi:MAG: methyltransferase domain-containing protein [Cyclobacteriaceae bacterium]|nr:methyltransferase domain-containing protein [Cyclobacteriaceae bacterium]
MRLRISPESVLERIALKLNLVPTPLVHTQIYFIIARAIMAAADLNIFETIGGGSKTLDEISNTAKTHPTATRHLLDCLAGIGYIKSSGGYYSIQSKYRRWLLRDFQSNITAKLHFQFNEWNWMTNLENYIRTGAAIEIHTKMGPSEWKDYQEGMKVLSVNAAVELAGKIKLSPTASEMLDIGGSYGLYSIELCKKYPALSSTILELPAALESVNLLTAKQGLAGRVKFKAGDAISDNLGDKVYDLILLNNVAHHFSAEENRKLAQKAARALKPGGMFGIGEFALRAKPGEGGVVASSSGLYFAMTSKSGSWSTKDINSWQKEAGLKVKKPINLLRLPGWSLLIATKSCIALSPETERN